MIYQQIFDILKDAIFGAEYVLTGTQILSLDLLSTFGALAVALLPVILCVSIAIRLIFGRRF